jgi:hypothetical protein
MWFIPLRSTAELKPIAISAKGRRDLMVIGGTERIKLVWELLEGIRMIGTPSPSASDH